MKNRTYLLLLLILWIPLGLRARTVKVWEGTPVRAASVTLTEYLPEGKPLAAVVVCPGGSYFWLDKEGEGSLVGEWLPGPLRRKPLSRHDLGPAAGAAARPGAV